MSKIKITEDELKQIVNESVKRVLSEGWGAGINAGLDKFKSTKDSKMGLSNRVTQSINAANMGSKYSEVYNMCLNLRHSIKNLGDSGFITKQEADYLIQLITDKIVDFLMERKEKLGLKTY
jgi:hypothetical protein